MCMSLSLITQNLHIYVIIRLKKYSFKLLDPCFSFLVTIYFSLTHVHSDGNMLLRHFYKNVGVNKKARKRL